MAGLKSEHEWIVSRTAVLWNTIADEEDGQPCSDSLISVIDSLRSKGNLVLTTKDFSGGKFGAQAASPFAHKEDLTPPVLSSASSRRSLGLDLPVVDTSKKARLRKRRGGATPDTAAQRSHMRVSTPRLRHDNSQIQFQPITSSSPMDNESQHLTDRQKEVRERQRANAALYSDAPTSSPQLPSRKSSQEEQVSENAVGNVQRGDSTPTHAKTYDDLISSTPTPRRGQVLQMDDFNDPPSSPPVPRPYPLLSEIQSRSRAGSTIDSWEFSSPPGSPSNSQIDHDDSPRPRSKDDKKVAKSRRMSKRQKRASAKAAQAANTPSRALLDEDVTNMSRKKSDARGSQEDPVSSQPPMTRQTTARQAAKSQEDHIDSTTPEVPRRRHSTRAVVQAEPAALDRVPNTTQSIPDEDRAKRSDGVAHEGESERKTRSGKRHSQHVDTSTSAARPRDCITVQPFSPSPLSPSEKALTEGLTTPADPSTSQILTEEAMSSGSRKKRKRGEQTQAQARDKRRRSVIQTPSSQNADGVEAGEHFVADAEAESTGNTANSAHHGRRSRQRNATTGGSFAEQCANSKSAKRQATESYGAADSGDTDEEVMSQLVTESKAASQSQTDASPHVSRLPVAQSGPVAKKTVQTAASGTALEAEPAQTANAKTSETRGEVTISLMETLREGLQQLRSASLTRENVYAMEDLLMDMKHELFEAERRGRETPKRRKRKSKA